MLSLDDYWNIAEKIISKNKRIQSSDNEMVGLVAEAVMKADATYNPSKGTKLSTWRFLLAEKAVRSCVRRVMRKEKFESLDNCKHLASSYRSPQDIIENSENVKESKDKLRKLLALVNPTERSCLEMSFLLGYTDSQIAQILNITSEGVRKSKITGIKLIRELSNGY